MSQVTVQAVSPGYGTAPRAVKAAGDANFVNLESAAFKPLGPDALDGLNQLSTGLPVDGFGERS